MRRPSAYRVFLTHKSEYHVRAHVCFAVRDRRTGLWHGEHWALDRQLASSIPDARGVMCSLGLPGVGDSLCFLVDGQYHYTSPLIAIEEREQMALPDRASPLLRRALVGRPAGSIRETY